MHDPLDEERHYIDNLLRPPSKADIELHTRAHIQAHEAAEHFSEYERLPSATVTGIKYGTYSFARMQAMSVMDVTRVMDRSGDATGTVNSKQLGVIYPDEGLCSYCFQSCESCPGHYALIRLARTVYNPAMVKPLCCVLNLICWQCGFVRFERSELDAATLQLPIGTARWEKIAQGVGTMHRCTRPITTAAAAARPPSAEDDDDTASSSGVCDAMPIRFIYQINKTSANAIKLGNATFTATDAMALLSRIQPDWAPFYLGFRSDQSRGGVPHYEADRELMISKFFVQGVLVSPRRARPRPGPKKVNYISTVADNIVRKNIALQHALDGDQPDDVLAKETDLFNAIADQFSANNNGRPQAPKGPADRVCNRKEGLFRGPGIRKRNDYSARVVARPAVRCRPDEISVPILFRAELTPRVRVTAYNLAYLRELQAKGEIVKVMCGRRRVPRVAIGRHTLRPGQYVRRYLQLKDPLNMLRNPTLHGRGMLVLNVGEFWYNLTAGPAVQVFHEAGGDFDGDTLTLMMLNDQLARAEGRLINAPRYNMTNYITGRGTLGPHYDGPISFSYLSTLAAVPRHVRDACLAHLAGYPALASLAARLRAARVPPTSGYALLSACMPAGLVYEGGSAPDGPLVVDGVVVRGKFTVDTLRMGERTVVKAILFQFGPAAAEEFVYRATLLADEYLRHHLVSVGYDELHRPVLDEAGAPLVPVLLADLERRVDALYLRRDMDAATREHHIYMHITNFSNVLHHHVQKAVQGTVVMDLTKAKVSKIASNMGLIVGAVSQQYIDEQRLPHPYIYGAPNPIAPTLVSRGFIKSSYNGGLTPEEYNHGVRTARRSRIDQNAASAPGELSTHIERAVDNLTVAASRAVIWTDGRVAQFRYGADGYSPARSWTSYGGDRHFRSPFNFGMIASELLAAAGAAADGFRDDGGAGPAVSAAGAARPVLVIDEVRASRAQAAVLASHLETERDRHRPFHPDLNRNDGSRILVLSGEHGRAALAAMRANLAGDAAVALAATRGLASFVLPAYLHAVFVEPVAASGGFARIESLLGGLPCAEALLLRVLAQWRSIYAGLAERFHCDPRAELVATIIAAVRLLAAEEERVQQQEQPRPEALPVECFLRAAIPQRTYDRVALRVASHRPHLPACFSPVPVLRGGGPTPAQASWLARQVATACDGVGRAVLVAETEAETEVQLDRLRAALAVRRAAERFPVLLYFDDPLTFGCEATVPELFDQLVAEFEAQLLAGAHTPEHLAALLLATPAAAAPAPDDASLKKRELVAAAEELTAGLTWLHKRRRVVSWAGPTTRGCRATAELATRRLFLELETVDDGGVAACLLHEPAAAAVRALDRFITNDPQPLHARLADLMTGFVAAVAAGILAQPQSLPAPEVVAHVCTVVAGRLDAGLREWRARHVVLRVAASPPGLRDAANGPIGPHDRFAFEQAMFVTLALQAGHTLADATKQYWALVAALNFK